MKNPNVLLIFGSLPVPPPETVFPSGLLYGSIEAIKGAYCSAVQILGPPRDGYNLTLKLNLSRLPQDEGRKGHCMRFKDSIDIALATAFLREFVAARCTTGRGNGSPSLWSPAPTLELKEAPAEALSSNA